MNQKKIDNDLKQINKLWLSLRPWQRKVIRLRTTWSAYIAIHKIPFAHWPLFFSLRAAMIMFALLFIFPQHPLALPAAAGGGLAFALMTH